MNTKKTKKNLRKRRKKLEIYRRGHSAEDEGGDGWRRRPAAVLKGLEGGAVEAKRRNDADTGAPVANLALLSVAPEV